MALRFKHSISNKKSFSKPKINLFSILFTKIIHKLKHMVPLLRIIKIWRINYCKLVNTYSNI